MKKINMNGYEMTRKKENTGAKNIIVVIAFFLLFSSSAMAAGDIVKAGTIFLNGTGMQIANPICSGGQALSTTPTGVFQCVAKGNYLFI